MDEPPNTGFAEVYPNRLVSNVWREIIIDTGATQSTLQDFKLPEAAGGYTFNDSNVPLSPSSNRFIAWKTYNDVLELAEYSLDVNLVGNQVKLKFQNTPVLDGVTILETSDQVYFLFATVASVHRLSFPHPRKLDNISATNIAKGFQAKSRSSIFYNISTETLRDPNSYNVLTNIYPGASSTFTSGGMPFPISFTAWLNINKEAVFVLAYSIGSLLVLKMSSTQEGGKIDYWELKQTSIMSKLWSGFVPSIMRGNTEGEEAAVSLTTQHVHGSDDYLIIALCRDLKIRIWSYGRRECLGVFDILQPNAPNSMTSNVKKANSKSVRRPILRKAGNLVNGNLHLAAYIGSMDFQKFFIYKLIFSTGQLKLKPISTLSAPKEDLIDYGLTEENIISLWQTSQGEFDVLHTNYQSESSLDWQLVYPNSIFMHTGKLKSLLVDPRETYLDAIFWSGNFSLQTIVKAISILSRVPEHTLIGGKINFLIEEATKIVENQIRNQVGVSELTADEYTNLEHNCWESFYTYCFQYHSVKSKPLGLIVDTKTGLTILLKKGGISFFRPMDQIDQIILDPSSYILSDLISEEPLLELSLNWVLKGIETISNCLNDQCLLEFEAGLLEMEVSEIVFDIIESYLIAAVDENSPHREPLKYSFDNMFSKATHLVEAIHFLLNILDLDSKGSFDIDDLDGISMSTVSTFTEFLSSNYGVSILSESIKQMCRLRFNFCRDLLIFQSFILQIADKNELSGEKLEKIRNTTIPTTIIYMQSYYFMCWVCDTPLLGNNLPSSIGAEDLEAQLSLLEVNEYINTVRMDTSSIAVGADICPKTILTQFINYKTGHLARRFKSYKMSQNDIDDVYNWNSALPDYINFIMQLIWPISSNFHLPELLLGLGYTELIIEYVRLLGNWCQRNTYSRQFLKACCFLSEGEPEKSIVFFNHAYPGIHKEEFLMRFISSAKEILAPAEASPSPEMTFTYYNKLIQLFQLYSYSESVVKLTNHALLFFEPSSNTDNMSSLLSTIFKSHLDLGNIQDAYKAMALNPDIVQRKICLRQFVVDLCEKSQEDHLISFNYNDMEEDFIAILESRARSSDLMSTDKEANKYYEILFAFFIKNTNYRRAASIIYEFGKRLSQELQGIASIDRQSKCFLIALNCLKIVHPKYAWIVKPTLRTLPSLTLSPPRLMSPPKRRYTLKEGNEDDYGVEENSFKSKREIQVIGIEEIKKEFELTNARVKLLSKNPKENAIANMPLSVEETITLQIANSMFDSSFKLATVFNLPVQQIFEGLVSKYVYLTQSNMSQYELNEKVMDIYDCFVENDTASLSYIANSDATPTNKMWNLTFTYLNEYEKPKQSHLHKCVAEKLLSSGIILPSSLKISYQQRNCRELLGLLMSYNYIEEAYMLAYDYIDAFIGFGTEFFDIKTPLLPNVSPICFPYSHINCLLNILEEEENPKFKEFQDQLLKKYDQFKMLNLETSKVVQESMRPI